MMFPYIIELQDLLCSVHEKPTFFLLYSPSIELLHVGFMNYYIDIMISLILRSLLHLYSLSEL